MKLSWIDDVVMNLGVDSPSHDVGPNEAQIPGKVIDADLEWARQNGKKDANGDPDVEWAQLYRETHDLTWHHHEDGRTMMLVPFELHRHLPHAGGRSAVRRAAKGIPET